MVADWLPAAALLFAGLGGLGFAWITAGPASGRYLVVAAPGSDMTDMVGMVRSANGGLTAIGHFTNIVIADSDRPDFPVAVRKAGAWLAVAMPDPAGCAGPLLQETRP